MLAGIQVNNTLRRNRTSLDPGWIYIYQDIIAHRNECIKTPSERKEVMNIRPKGYILPVGTMVRIRGGATKNQKRRSIHFGPSIGADCKALGFEPQSARQTTAW